MSVLIVIPARFTSSRFPGKPLEQLSGATGVRKSLVRRTWEAAHAAKGVDRLLVATDDARIMNEVEKFGGEAIMTSPGCSNGTERCAEAVEILGGGYDVIVNVQGDAPLTPPWFIENLAAAVARANAPSVATPVIRCAPDALNRIVRDREQSRIGGTTAVFDSKNRALYFSKQVIPWVGSVFAADNEPPVFHHVGIYAYTPEALRWYGRNRPGILEISEGLEQLRFLEYGKEILCVEMDARDRPFWEVNNPGDVEVVERMLADAHIV